VRELRALKKITTRPPAYAGGPRLPRQSGAERRARLRDGRCPIHGRVFDLQHHPSLGTVIGRCTRSGCTILAVVEAGIWKLTEEQAALLDDNHLDDVDALMTLARCLVRAEERAAPSVRDAVRDELARWAEAWGADAVDRRPGDPEPDAPEPDAPEPDAPEPDAPEPGTRTRTSHS
jgi:hypothetical protein